MDIIPPRPDRDEFEDRFFTAESPFMLGKSAETKGETEAEGPAELTVPEWHAPAKASSEFPYGLDPYADVRPALRPEHASLTAHDITLVVGRQPALLALHRMLTSPQPNQAVLAVLLGNAGRRSVHLNGSDVPVPAYLRLLSRLCHEAAGQAGHEVGEERAATEFEDGSPIGYPPEADTEALGPSTVPVAWSPPIRANELGATGTDRLGSRTFNCAKFSVFVPAGLASATTNRVHVFFSPGGVTGPYGGNAVAVHGLRAPRILASGS